MTDAEHYELAQYTPIETLKKTDSCIIEVVYNVLDNKKFIKRTFFSDKREVYSVLKQIKGHHIPQVFQVYFGSETIIIEEYMEGFTLSDAIEKKVHLKANLILNGLLDAVNALHNNGIIHRDIKPQNIIIDKLGEPYLIDFGISRIYRENRYSDTENMGTIGYAPPEQFGFSQSDYRSDIYALGKTIDEIGRGIKLPWIYKHIAKKCMAFDPNRRYQNTKEILRALSMKRRMTGAIIALFFCAIFCGILFQLKNPIAESTENIAKQGMGNATEDTPKITEENQNEIVDPSMEGTMDDVSPATSDSSLIVVTDTNDSCIKSLRVGEGTTIQKLDLGRDIFCDIVATKTDSELLLDINSAYEFQFAYTKTREIDDYPHTDYVCEIILYDMNGDGISEVIPMLSDGCLVSEPEEEYLLQNGTNAWCIVYYPDNEYKLADGIMTTMMDPLCIYESSPGIIWTDFPGYYVLNDGKIEYCE